MKPAIPSNIELAKMFFDVLIRTSTNHKTIVEQQRLIEHCPKNIGEAFAIHGALKGFSIPRLFTKYYPMLEIILRDGVDKAAEAVVRNDVASQRRRQFKGIPGSSSAHVRSDETSGGWDDAIKRIES